MKKILVSVLTACGLVSAQAAIFEYTVTFSPISAPGASGSGNGTVNYDDVNHLLQVQAVFSGLSSPTTVSHIHGPTPTPFTGSAGVITTTPTFAGFPAGVTSGSYSNTLDLTLASSWNAAFVGTNSLAVAESMLAAALAEGRAYWNIHTDTFGGGEINGFITVVPEPSSFALLGLGTLGTAVWFGRRKRAM